MVISGIFLTIKYGLQPRPIRLINLSSFDTPLKLAQSIELRLHEELKQAPILLFGFQPEKAQQLEVIKEFVRSSKDSGLIYDTVVADDNLSLPAEIPVSEKIDSQAKLETLAAGLKAALVQKRKVLLILPSVYSAQLVGGNVADLLRRKFEIPLMSFTLVELPRNREQEKAVSIPCLMTDADSTGVGALGCAILQTGRAHYRKKMESGKRTGLMDQRGVSDFLIFYSNEAEKLRQ